MNIISNYDLKFDLVMLKTECSNPLEKGFTEDLSDTW